LGDVQILINPSLLRRRVFLILKQVVNGDRLYTVNYLLHII